MSKTPSAANGIFSPAKLFLPFFLFCLLGLVPSGMAQADKTEIKPVKYVFLFIGDGMATPQRMMTDLYLKSIGEKGLVMNELPIQGFSTTYSSTSLITDSAAAATAIATGQKTHDGGIGVDVNNKPLETVAEIAKKKGKKIGIITSTSINHATPAAFYAHQHNRGEAYKIGLDMINSGFDYFAGGGLMDPQGTIMVTPEGRWVGNPDKDKNVNLYDILKEKSFTYVKTKQDFDKLNASTKKPIYVENPNLDDEANLYYAIDGTSADIRLADYVAKAIEVLDNDNGFFIMTEGGKIDWTCHANDIGGTIAEVLNLDAAISVAYDFAKKHPNDTLIVVTGDHETGAMTLGFTGTKYSLYLANLQHQTKSFKTASNELAAFKKEKKAKGETVTFDEIKPFITKTFGMKFEGDPKTDGLVLDEYELNKLKAAFDRSMGATNEYAPTENKRIMYGGYDPLIMSCMHILSNKSGVAWTTFDHSAMPVGTSAAGVNASIFGNFSDNTDIAKNLRKVLEK